MTEVKCQYKSSCPRCFLSHVKMWIKIRREGRREEGREGGKREGREGRKEEYYCSHRKGLQGTRQRDPIYYIFTTFFIS